MEEGRTPTGSFDVNGRRATAIDYAVRIDHGALRSLALKFIDGNDLVASIRTTPERAQAILGAGNFGRITYAAAAAGAEGRTHVNGELKGDALEFREVTLAGHPAAAAENAITPQAPTKASAETPVPESIRQRFLQVGQAYYFPDRTLAFKDRGDSLKAVSNNAEVVRALVTIAESRGWSAVRVSGNDQFKSAVWREATLRGIAVDGYRPTEVEQAGIAHQANRRGAAEADGAGSKGDRHGMPPPAKAAAQASSASARHEGQLLEHGAAPYRFDPNQRLSYYVRLATDSGERVLWGVDLERALVESRSRVQIGDQIAIENRGAQPITVKAPQRDASGQVIGEQELATHRNSWLIETQAEMAQRAERAAAFANGVAARQELVREHPDLSGAVVALWLGEQFADRLIERPEDRTRVVQLVKERLTHALETGEPINAPKLKQEVARKLDAIRDDFDEIAQRARSKAARRGDRPPRQREPDELSHAMG